MKPLILASTSIYRKRLLSRLGIPFTALAPTCDESLAKKTFLKSKGLKISLEGDGDAIKNPIELSLAIELASHLACLKARNVDTHEVCVIGGDQLVHFEGKILGKPITHSQAIATLTSLQGKSHQLVTSVCFRRAIGTLNNTDESREFEEVFTNLTELRMRPLSLEQIETYLRRDSPLDCAGSYKIESAGISLFEEIRTEDFTAIEGLPLLKLGTLLRAAGYAI